MLTVINGQTDRQTDGRLTIATSRHGTTCRWRLNLILSALRASIQGLGPASLCFSTARCGRSVVCKAVGPSDSRILIDRYSALHSWARTRGAQLTAGYTVNTYSKPPLY